MPYLDRTTNAQAVYLVGLDSEPLNLFTVFSQAVAGGSSDARDTNGDPVPTYKAHSFTYDQSGNIATDTVSDGPSTWVRSYTYDRGAQSTDSGWVKQ